MINENIVLMLLWTLRAFHIPELQPDKHNILIYHRLPGVLAHMFILSYEISVLFICLCVWILFKNASGHPSFRLAFLNQAFGKSVISDYSGLIQLLLHSYSGVFRSESCSAQ